jgi:Secretion system C-terminal sorting domain
MKKQLLCVGLCSTLVGYSQQNTVASGGDASGAGGTVSYTIGQIDYEALSSASGTVTQGVQQPFEIFAVGLDELGYSISASLYPNPTVNSVILTVDAWDTYSDAAFQLTDEQGRIVRLGEVKAQETTIQVSDLANACYYLNIVVSDRLVKSFKLIKNN